MGEARGSSDSSAVVPRIGVGHSDLRENFGDMRMDNSPAPSSEVLSSPRRHARTLAPAAVPGPLPDTLMNDAYLTAFGRVAYLWGWPLVNLHNRLRVMARLTAPARPCSPGWFPPGRPGRSACCRRTGRGNRGG
ncbi:hypothetical protein [Streptomyces sp. OR43]|uniref:hypothetical protein n=1 Tax=Streptomyces sp. or43 TaxID=2478957 RepID=UPI0016517C52|nr:hypothetical protein [Streptomyces sp. or43]